MGEAGEVGGGGGGGSAAKKRLVGILKECGTESAKVLEGAMRKAGGAERSDEGRVTSDERGKENLDGLENLEGLDHLGDDGKALANENPYHCPKCGKFAGFNGHCEKCGYTLSADESMKRAGRLLDKAQSGTMLKPIDGLAYRDEIGQIDLEVGKRGVGKAMEHGAGLAKLVQKHDTDLSVLPETLAKGEIMPTTEQSKVGHPYDPTRRAIVNGNYVAFLERKDKRRWKITTHYRNADDAARAEEVKRWLRSEDRSQLRGGAE